jgi:hypothetical protein
LLQKRIQTVDISQGLDLLHYSGWQSPKLGA